MKRLYPLAVLGLLALTSRSARATPIFPAVVQTQLGLATTPDCSLCHNGTQSAATVTTPFGKAIRERGVLPYDEAALKAALDSLTQEKIDSDGDGVDDIDELKAGTDPNVGVGGVTMATPEYRCSAGLGAGGTSYAWLFGVGIAGAVVLRRQSRRRV